MSHAASFGGFVASGRWQTDEPRGAGVAWLVGRDTPVAVGQFGDARVPGHSPLLERVPVAAHSSPSWVSPPQSWLGMGDGVGGVGTACPRSRSPGGRQSPGC